MCTPPKKENRLGCRNAGGSSFYANSQGSCCCCVLSPHRMCTHTNTPLFTGSEVSDSKCPLWPFPPYDVEDIVCWCMCECVGVICDFEASPQQHVKKCNIQNQNKVCMNYFPWLHHRDQCSTVLGRKTQMSSLTAGPWRWLRVFWHAKTGFSELLNVGFSWRPRGLQSLHRFSTAKHPPLAT